MVNFYSNWFWNCFHKTFTVYYENSRQPQEVQTLANQ